MEPKTYNVIEGTYSYAKNSDILRQVDCYIHSSKVAEMLDYEHKIGFHNGVYGLLKYQEQFYLDKEEREMIKMGDKIDLLINQFNMLNDSQIHSDAYSGVSGRRFRKHPDSKPETSGHLVDRFDSMIFNYSFQDFELTLPPSPPA